MKFIDISWPITNNMTCYKDTANVSIKSHKKFSTDQVRETTITISSHTGTHIDAPSHFLSDGKHINELAITSYCGKAKIIDMTHINNCITAKDLDSYTSLEDHIILIKTKNSALESTALFNHQFIYLDVSAAHYLVTQKIRAVGIDYLGIERNQPDHRTHTTFMQHNIPIIEGLRLQHVKAKEYMLFCFPLLIPDIDGAPARAMLVECE